MNTNPISSPPPSPSPTWSTACDTLVHVVRHWAETQPSHTAYVYVADGREQSLSFGQLHERAQAIAAELATKQAPRTTALVLHPLGLAFVEAFFACLYAGVIAVPLHPGRGKSASARLSGVVLDCDPRAVLTTSAVAATLSALFDAGGPLRGLELVETDRIEAAPPVAAADRRFEPAPAEVAFLQYTSGSTSQPKGTVVTHRNIMANQAMLSSAFHTDRSTVIASWLPVFHDMGLIGNVLHAAYLGVPAILLSTLGFIKSPISWLRAIARYRATFSGAPNFAYDLCVAKTTPEERAGLDLGSWRVAFNGAEPVRHHTLEAFGRTFEPHGFRRAAFVPTYGLAEATLVVSGTGGVEPVTLAADARLLKEGVIAPALDPAVSQVLVSTGRWDHGDQHVVIVDAETEQPCPPGRVGEIWISGSHVAAGYWQKEAATRETFGATLAGDERRYLRTGDLGFIDASGLFIAGRMKDLIIFRGQNVYPQDLELTVELAAPQLRPGCTAAFALEQEAGAGVVVVAEMEQRQAASAELMAQVVRQVQEQHELPLERLVLVRRNTVPKTTSGKIQRRKCKEQLLSGALDVVAEWHHSASVGPDELYERVATHARDWIARRLRVAPEQVALDAAIASLGLDSIQKVELARSLEGAFGVTIPESSFFVIETLADLVRAVLSSRGLTPAASGAPVVSPAREAAAPATPILPAFSALTWDVRRD